MKPISSVISTLALGLNISRGAGIIPIIDIKNKTFFLFGKNRNENRYSDFGGRCEKLERNITCASREAYEEFNGLLPNEWEKIWNTYTQMDYKKNKIESTYYTTFMIPYIYDVHLPLYFNENNKFMSRHFPQYLSEKHGYYETKLIKWFSCASIKKKWNLFREFYAIYILPTVWRKFCE